MENPMKAMVRAMLAQDDATLIAMSGGAARVQDGRTLDARIQAMEAQARARPQPESIDLEEARAGARMMVDLFVADPAPGVQIEDGAIPAPHGSIPVRFYRPQAQNAALPAIVFYHYGGGVIGDLDTCHVFCTTLASRTKTAIVNVDYRLAPEHVWPSGLDDCLVAYDWTRANGEKLGAKSGAAAVAGDSIGGNFSAIVAQQRRDAPPALQVLIYPATDWTATGGSMQTMGDAFPLTQPIMHWFAVNYAPAGADLKDPRLSPAFGDLNGLSPALIYTAGFDPIRDQGEAYAKALQAAGVKTLHREYASLAHSFTSFTGVVPDAAKACEDIADDIAAALQRSA
jgi:acetyl esterase/lipase